jgi:hypothetical protein
MQIWWCRPCISAVTGRIFTAFVLLSVFFGAARASTINLSATIDLQNFSATLTNIDAPLSAAATIQTGDSVNLSVTFANNKALELTAVSSPAAELFWILHTGGAAFFTIDNINLTLTGLNTNGTFTNPFTAGTTTGGVGNLGPNNVNLGLSVGQFLSFTGFNLTYDVVSLTSPELFNNVLLLGSAGSVTGSIVDAPTTPLPAALPLFATGLGALGLLGWRRKRKAFAAH